MFFHAISKNITFNAYSLNTPNIIYVWLQFHMEYKDWEKTWDTAQLYTKKRE